MVGIKKVRQHKNVDRVVQINAIHHTGVVSYLLQIVDSTSLKNLSIKVLIQKLGILKSF